jgi:nitronate monooxygenase
VTGIRTWLSERFDLAVPVVSAPMAGVAGGRLAAAVTRAGGLGTIGVGSATTPSWVAEQCAIAADAGPFGVGLMAWALAAQPGQLEAVLEARPALVSIGFGPYAGHVPRLRAAGITVVTQVGTLEEARRAEAAGVDGVVARGAEGGGHGRNDVGALPLLQMVLETTELPVLAAGGVATARGLAAAVAAGAAGAWVGTAFLTCEEAMTTPAAAAALFAAREVDTAYGRVFDVAQGLGWPTEFGGRALRNPFFDRWDGQEAELGRNGPARAALAEARRQEDFETAFIYTGQGVGLLARSQPAAEIVEAFAEARALLAAAAERL